MKRLLLPLLAALALPTVVNASHGYSSSKCEGEHIKEKDKVKVLISTNQTGVLDPTKITNSSESKKFFSNWKEYNNVIFGYGLISWGILHKRSGKNLLVISNERDYSTNDRWHRISWYDKNGKVWESSGVNHKSGKDFIKFSWECRFVKDGIYSKRFMELYYGNVFGRPGHFAAIIDFTQYYKIHKPSF